jgi:hypothetical protein
MVHSISRFALFIMVSLVVAGTATAQDPLKVGTKIYRKLLENERVRMLEVTFAPGRSIRKEPRNMVVIVKPLEQELALD